jgi:hypothetical protein
VVYWPAEGNVEIALCEGVTKKEVKKPALFDGKTLEFVCSDCYGTGYVTCDQFDPDSMQYMRGVGTTRCMCQNKDTDHE